jgi:geranylgeranyl pyrophosphate synthase
MSKPMESQTNAAAEQQALATLQEELAQVQHQVTTAIDDLYSPLRDLVRSQLKQAAPFVRAAVVLTTGVGNPDTEELRAKRILLAAALELLYVAQHIHHLLLTEAATNGDSSIDKSLLGSVILAGDYCFSRSAIFAAQTNSPAVVMIFADALKAVNEGNLRQHFTHTAVAFNESQKLLEAGARAAATLATQEQEIITATAAWGRDLAKYRLANEHVSSADRERTLRHGSLLQQARRQALLLWLAQPTSTL